uniref:DOCK5 n=3 Tax=Poeciliopsis prolifica TaxID=188132 RepID=A0A0S7EUG6_9TELE
MAYVKLMRGDGTTLKDGRHELFVYKVDVKKADDAKVYLSLPATLAEVEQIQRQTMKPFHHSGVIPVTKDSFQIATLTCSTKLTQNVDLLGLLNWRSNSQDLDQILQRLMEVEGGEIVKVISCMCLNKNSLLLCWMAFVLTFSCFVTSFSRTLSMLCSTS